MKVLMTGASGGIGTRMCTLMKGIYPTFRLSDLQRPKDLGNDEEFVEADLADMAQVARAVEGDWDTIHQANIVGCYNLFEAARQAGVKRVVFASSNHVVGFYPRRRKIGIDEPVRPDSRYGVSKAFGEALGALYAHKHGMRVTSLRIGNFADHPIDQRRLAIWLHPDDLVQLIRIGLEHPEIRNEIFYGCSDNERSWWDNESAFRFGYRPKHRAEDYRDHALAEQAKLAHDTVGDWYQGGTFCSAEYDSERGPETY